MNRRALLRRASIAFGAFVVLGVSALGPAQSASAMSCFAVAGKMTCIGAGIAPPGAFMPPVIAPIGADADGDDHHIVIEDDGGRRVARG